MGLFVLFPFLLIAIIALWCCGTHSFSQKSDMSSISIQKRKLLEVIAKNVRRETSTASVLVEVKKLENLCDPLSMKLSCVDGSWSLIFSTMTDSSSSSSSFSSNSLTLRSDQRPTVIDGVLSMVSEVSDTLFKIVYKQIFRFAPFLAGSQESLNSLDNNLKVTNTQYIDISKKKVSNDVTIIIKPIQQKLNIKVSGDIRVISENTFEIIFTSCNLQGISLPLPRPRGLLTNTYCDEDIRISRGGKGGIFVVNRIKSSFKNIYSL